MRVFENDGEASLYLENCENKSKRFTVQVFYLNSFVLLFLPNVFSFDRDLFE